jgi:hypothetical protein
MSIVPFTQSGRDDRLVNTLINPHPDHVSFVQFRAPSGNNKEQWETRLVFFRAVVWRNVFILFQWYKTNCFHALYRAWLLISVTFQRVQVITWKQEAYMSRVEWSRNLLKSIRGKPNHPPPSILCNILVFTFAPRCRLQLKIWTR